MKIKRAVISTILGLSLAAAPLSLNAATKEDVNKIINKAFATERPGLDFGRSPVKLKYLEKTEQISQDTERRTYFSVYYLDAGKKKIPLEANLIIEDWKSIKNLELEDYGYEKGTYDGYIVNQKIIVDGERQWIHKMPDGIIDEVTTAKIVRTEPGLILSYKRGTEDISTKEAQKIYDDNIESFLDSK